MKYTVGAAALFVMLLATTFQSLFLAPVCHGQSVAYSEDARSGVEPLDADALQPQVVSGKKAFALSLLLPGLGHRYVHGGDWDGWASIFAVADAGLWAGLLGSQWRRDQLVESYTTLASVHAGAETEGKGRDFFLNLASYMSSDEYTDVQLRIRNWDQVDYAADPSYQWEWDSERHYNEYRDAREDAESLRRRRTFIVTTLVANRLIAGFTALRAARRAEAARAEFSFAPPPAGSSLPVVRFGYTF